MDVVDLGTFYTTKLGQTARRLISLRLAQHSQPFNGATMMGLGYSLPYLDRYHKNTPDIFNFMPARLGATHWPYAQASKTAMVDTSTLPLEDSCIDFALLTHCAELSHRLPDMLNEVWRVMSGQGKIILVLPNRTGMWARVDKTPFGHGRPFSKNQITKYLREANFVPTAWSNAVFIPPSQKRFILQSATAIERAGMWVSPGLSGVLIVEATKQIYSVSSRSTAKVRLPKLKPQVIGVPASVAHLSPNHNKAEKF